MKKRFLTALILAFIVQSTVFAQSGGGALHARYLFDVKVLGRAQGLLRPQQIRYDRSHQEFYIADTGNDRIVILDENGLNEFEFTAKNIFHAPIDIAVSSDGKIYVLGSLVGGRCIQVFDYNGDYLYPFVLTGNPDAAAIDMVSLAIDEQDVVYILDNHQQQVLICDLTGHFLSEIQLFADMNSKDRGEQALGNLYVSDDQICVPAPMIGSVYCYKKDGSFVKMIGQKGGAYGELSFPVAISKDSQGNYLVLDKHRYTIVEYDDGGMPIGEFGGKGIGPGWFYHPISMIIDSSDRIWVAQIFLNRIQVLQLAPPGESNVAQELSSTQK
jgi:DNA-binding beta-propeller fold protein YncE